MNSELFIFSWPRSRVPRSDYADVDQMLQDIPLTEFEQQEIAMQDMTLAFERMRKEVASVMGIPKHFFERM